LPISCKNRSGKYGFQPLLIFFSTCYLQNTCLLNDFDNNNSLWKFRSSYGSSIFKIMKKNQFTRTATQPHWNRKFRQFKNDQYCNKTVLVRLIDTCICENGVFPLKCTVKTSLKEAPIQNCTWLNWSNFLSFPVPVN